MPATPVMRTACGGLRISTSRPYALCHQLSNGTDAIMAKAPQIQTQAPNGPRNPQNRTVRARASSGAANVNHNTYAPQVMPAAAAPNCSSKCGGDQSESRPIVMCHEMSHNAPIRMQLEENSTAGSTHDSVSRVTLTAFTAYRGSTAIVAMLLSLVWV